MADRILVSVSEMNIAIGRYLAAKSDLQDAYSKIEAAQDHLDNCYKGPAYAVLKLRLSDIHKNVVTADKAIDETIQGLRNTINEMTDAEDDIKKDVNSKDIGTTPPVYF